MSYEDRTLTCQECEQPFTFSADDQSYHAEKGYTNEPKRCPSCRQARRNDRDNSGLAAGAGLVEGRVRCTLRSVRNVVKIPQSPSCPVVTVQSTVAIATADRAGDKGQHPGTRRPKRGAIFAPLFIYPLRMPLYLCGMHTTS